MDLGTGILVPITVLTAVEASLTAAEASNAELWMTSTAACWRSEDDFGEAFKTPGEVVEKVGEAKER